MRPWYSSRFSVAYIWLSLKRHKPATRLVEAPVQLVAMCGLLDQEAQRNEFGAQLAEMPAHRPSCISIHCTNVGGGRSTCQAARDEETKIRMGNATPNNASSGKSSLARHVSIDSNEYSMYPPNTFLQGETPMGEYFKSFPDSKGNFGHYGGSFLPPATPGRDGEDHRRVLLDQQVARVHLRAPEHPQAFPGTAHAGLLRQDACPTSTAGAST